jgi:hypothetical protein
MAVISPPKTDYQTYYSGGFIPTPEFYSYTGTSTEAVFGQQYRQVRIETKYGKTLEYDVRADGTVLVDETALIELLKAAKVI